MPPPQTNCSNAKVSLQAALQGLAFLSCAIILVLVLLLTNLKLLVFNLDYYDFEYGDEIPIGLAMFPMINIKNAPSKSLAQEKYKDNYIHEIKVVNKKQKEIINKSDEKKISIIDFFNNYIKDRNDLESWTITRLKNCVRSKE